MKVFLIAQETKFNSFGTVPLLERWEKVLSKTDSGFVLDFSSGTMESFLKMEVGRNEPVLAVFTHSVVDDITIEKVFEIIAQNDTGDKYVLFKVKDRFVPVLFCSAELFNNIKEFCVEEKGDYNALFASIVKNGPVEVKEIVLERYFIADITDERSSKDAQWGYLKYLQFRPGGVIAKYLNRPVSIRMTRHLIKYPWITPNLVTIVDFFIGLIAVACFLMPSYFMAVLGGIIMQFNSIVDGIDGEVARLRHSTSSLGAWLDSFSDETLGALFYSAIGYHLYISSAGTEDSLGIWFLIIGVFTGLASYVYALTHWHCKWKHGLGFFYWWECYKPRKEVQRSTSLASYLKKLFWRESIIFFIMLAAIFNFLDVFIIISFFPALVNLILISIHIFVKKARW